VEAEFSYHVDYRCGDSFLCTEYFRNNMLTKHFVADLIFSKTNHCVGSEEAYPPSYQPYGHKHTRYR
jgi:hypothetical protein